MTRRLVMRALLPMALLMPTVAPAQQSVKPEVLLLVDASTRMGLRADGSEAICSPLGTANPEGADYQPNTLLNVVKEALVGEVKTFDNGPDKWCIVHEDEERARSHQFGRDGVVDHYRPMCCAMPSGANCAEWKPCGEDHGRSVVHRDAVRSGAARAWLPNGTVKRYAEDVKFSLMVSDGKPSAGRGADGGYSYGNEDLRDPVNQPINLGARSFGVWDGALIKGSKGQIADDGDFEWLAAVDESTSQVRRHNELVMHQVRRIVPYGGAPLSAMLSDAQRYVAGQAQEDGLNQCRRRVAVLITQGQELALYGGQDCPCDANSRCVDDQCVYPAGFPYQTAESYAGELLEDGVPVYVVVFDEEGGPGHQRAQSIALEGSPNEGAGGGAGVFRVDNLAKLQKALDRIARDALAGRRTRSKPLVISSSVADYCLGAQFPCARPDDAVVQWRINAFSEVEAGGVYGRVQATELSCAENGIDNGRPGSPTPTRTPKLYEEVLADQEGPRRTVSTDEGQDDAVFGVVGGDQNMFNRWGGLGGLYNSAEVRALTGEEADANQNGADGVNALPDHEPEGQLAMGLKLNGYFGERGLPEDRGEARRQLGGVLTGDLVALQAPELGINTPSYQRYQQEQARRPTLVASAARDGMLHVFRAYDGREVFNFVPRVAWRRLGEGETPIDGPLDVADIVPCRTIGEGGPDTCPSDPASWKFQAWLTGATGDGGANIYGVNMTKAVELARDLDRPVDPRQDFGDDGIWDVLPDDVVPEGEQPPTLGLAKSRPVLTHVRVRDQVRAAVVTGCGDDPDEAQGGLPMSDGPGRCVLVLDAGTGEVIRRFTINDNVRTVYPFTGSPVAYPAGGIAPASRLYVGDRAGRLWRFDVRDADPVNWTANIAWPPGADDGAVDEDEAGGYELGRDIVDRPSVSLRPDGGLVVVFGTGEQSVSQGSNKSFVVSFTDRAVIDADGDVSYAVSRNWVMELGANERASGAVLTRSEIAYFTTRQQAQNAANCEGTRGRLYGVHFYKRFVDQDGEPATFQAAGGRRLNVVPSLPQFAPDGSPLGQKGLSVILPPGRVAYGLAIARTPSCVEGQAATTDLVLNVADESAGGAAGIQGEAAATASKLEVVQNEVLREVPLQGKIFARGSGSAGFELCLDCSPDGRPVAGIAGPGLAPFPTEVAYWGSTFLN